VPADRPVHSRQGERAFRTVADPGSRANSAPAVRRAAIDPVTGPSPGFLSDKYGGQAMEPGSSPRVFPTRVPHTCSARWSGQEERGDTGSRGSLRRHPGQVQQALLGRPSPGS
jgi:hypothetical protein